MIYICEKKKRIEWKHALEDFFFREGGGGRKNKQKRIFIWELSSEGRGKIARSRAIAAKTAQVRFQLFPMLHLILFLMIL